MNLHEQLELTQWFIQEKDRPLFIFDLLKKHIFNQSGIDRQQCQRLLQQMRQSTNLLLRQQALEYTVPWKEEKNKKTEQRRSGRSVANVSVNTDSTEMNLFEVFSMGES